MKLLICTQVVDSEDSNLGFFCQWIEEFARHCEQVEVICLKEGGHSLPKNVRVYSLGKESARPGQHPQKIMIYHNFLRVRYAWRFWRLIWKLRKDYDAVFVHMNPEYIVLCGFLWKRWGKKTGLWYAHHSVTFKLKRAMRFVDCVFTVTNNSFPILSPKVIPLGHGVDTELFVPTIRHESTEVRMITVGRIAESKHLLEMVEMLDVLYARGGRFLLTIVGKPTTRSEMAYAERVRGEVKKRSYAENIVFKGAVPHRELPALLHEHDVALNFATTGNMDKAGLEALASGVLLFSTNKAFEPLLSTFGLYCASMVGEHTAEKLKKFFGRTDRSTVLSTLHNKVVAEHSLSNLIPKIVAKLDE